MYHTLSGIELIVVGCALIVFRERITRFYASLHRRTLGIELPRQWALGGLIFVAVLMLVQGLLVLLRLA